MAESGRVEAFTVDFGADDDGFGHVHGYMAEHEAGFFSACVHSLVVNGEERIPAVWIDVEGRPVTPRELAERAHGLPLVAFDAEAFRALTFASEDNLSKFVAALSDEEAAAIYALLYGRGVRYDTGALGKWRRSR